MAIKSEISMYLDFLKEKANYSGRRIASLSEEFGYKFSDATLIKSYKEKYEVPEATSEGILKVLQRLVLLEEKKNPELSEEIKKSFDLTDVKLIKPNENKIEMPWEESHQYELEAEKVIGITPTLEWARHKIDNIIEVCSREGNKKKKYHYILTEQRGITNKLVIEEKVEEAKSKGVLSENEEGKQIEIRELYNLEEYKSNVTTIPIPYDIVIYENTYDPNWDSEKDRRTIVVTSKVAVDHSTIKESEKENYEDIIIDPNRGEELKIWAKKIWNKLEGSKDERND